MARKKGGPRDRTNLLEGRVEILVHKDKVLIHREVLKNILLYQGLAEIIRTLSFTTPSTAPRIITRMAIGDQGTIPSSSTTPKVPVKSATGLFHEVYRQDVSGTVPTLYDPVGFSYTGNTTINVNQITNLSSTAGITQGMIVTGTGIPIGTVVSNPTLSPTSIEISNEAISSNTGANYTFAGVVNQCEFDATFDAIDVPLTSFSNPSTPVINEVGLVIINPAASAGLVRSPVAAPNPPPSDEVVLSLRTFTSVPFVAANNISITVRYTLFTE